MLFAITESLGADGTGAFLMDNLAANEVSLMRGCMSCSRLRVTAALWHRLIAGVWLTALGSTVFREVV